MCEASAQHVGGFGLERQYSDWNRTFGLTSGGLSSGPQSDFDFPCDCLIPSTSSIEGWARKIISVLCYSVCHHYKSQSLKVLILPGEIYSEIVFCL